MLDYVKRNSHEDPPPRKRDTHPLYRITLFFLSFAYYKHEATRIRMRIVRIAQYAYVLIMAFANKRHLTSHFPYQ